MIDDEEDLDEPEGNRRLKHLLVSGGALLGAAAIYNAFSRKGVDLLPNLIGGEEGGFEWRDRRIAFTRRGEGPPILFIHGIHAAAWSYEWRDNVDYFARRNTVYTLDLLGFGRSERPPLRYSARLFISLISDFVAQVINAPCTLVASSLAGAYAIVLAARDPHRFPALALIAPTGLVRLNQPATVSGDAGRFAIDAPVAGTAAFNALVSRRSLRHFLRKAYADDTLVTPEMIEAYYANSHQRGARHAPAAFLSGHLNIDVRQALRRLTQPGLLVWGEQGSITPVEEFRGFRALKPDFEMSVLSPAGDLPQHERADDFNVILSAWLNRLSLSSGPTPDTLPGTPEGSRLT